MRTHPMLLWFVLLIIFAFSGSSAGAQRNVQSIEIHSGWGGLGASQNAVVRVERKGGRFVSNGRSVRATEVQALVAALSAPPVTKPSMTNLGISTEWLNSNVTSQRPRARAQAVETTVRQQELFRKSFTNLETVANVLPSLFRFTRFDDYPGSKVDVNFDDGSTLTAESHSYYVFMLPWKVEGQPAPTYNAEISRALASLMPAKTVNKERLAGHELVSQLTDAVMSWIETEWNLLGSDERAGEALKTLRTVYEVVTAELTPYHHPEYGTATYRGEPEEMNLHASVRKPTFPRNVTDALVLRYANGKVEGVDYFLKAAGKYESLVLSVPWLNQYIRDNPRVAFQISYVHDHSFGDKAMRVFTADMKLRGREDLIQQVKAQQSDIALLIVGNTYSESYWLLFPDKHMMLWRYGGASGLLKWAREDFKKGQCSEYENNYGGCSGREVTPEGSLAPEHVPQDQVCMAKYRSSHTESVPEDVALFPVMNRGRAGFIDQTGKLIIPMCFDKLGDFSEGLARFERDGNWGYIDRQGRVVVEPKFPWAEEFSEGLAKVQVSGSSLGFDGRWGFIDKTGKLVIPPNYTESSSGKSNIGRSETDGSFHDGLARVELDRKTGYIDKSGRLVIPAEFAYGSSFSEGFAAVTRLGLGNDWGFIDTSGKWIIEPQFEWVNSFSEGLAAVKKAGTCGYIDKTGKVVLQPPVPASEKDCRAVWGTFSEGLSRWKFGDKYGFIDHDGNVAIKPKYELAFDFSEGLAAVRVDNKWGYIDKSGEMVVVPNKLFTGDNFHNGFVFVRSENGGYGYLDKSGKYVWTPTPLYADTQ